jgi:hypothetical protein
MYPANALVLQCYSVLGQHTWSSDSLALVWVRSAILARLVALVAWSGTGLPPMVG